MSVRKIVLTENPLATPALNDYWQLRGLNLYRIRVCHRETDVSQLECGDEDLRPWARVNIDVN